MGRETEHDSSSPGVVDRHAASPSSPSSLDHNADADIKGDRPRLHAKTFLAVLAMCIIYFAQLLCIVGAGTQGQTIAAHFGSKDVVWFSAPITILTVVLGPPVSQAADYWGRKWFLVVFSSAGVVGAIIVARASSMPMAIAGFTVLGISFGVQPLLHTVAAEVLPRRWRPYAQAAALSGSSMGSVTGLLVGAALNRNYDPASSGFRYYFYMTMGCYALATLLCVAVYHPLPTPKQVEYRGRTLEKLRKLDWVGYVLLLVGLVLFCVALSYSRNPYPWSDAHVAAPFAVGVALVLALVVYETWFTAEGMFHHGLFTGNRNFTLALVCVFAEGIAFFAANIYYAFEVSVLYETDALLVNTRFSISLFALIVSAVISGVYCSVTRRIRWITVLAFLIFTAFFAAMAKADRTTDAPVWGYTVLLGFGLGMTLTALVTVAQLSTPPELISIASGLVISVRSLGGTIGIAIYTALFNDAVGRIPENVAAAVLPKGLSPDALPAFIGALSAHNETALAHVPGVNPGIIQAGAGALLDTFTTAFSHVWIAAACFVGLAAVVAVFLFDPRNEFNNRIDATVEKDAEGSDNVSI